MSAHQRQLLRIAYVAVEEAIRLRGPSKLTPLEENLRLKMTPRWVFAAYEAIWALEQAGQPDLAKQLEGAR